MKTQAHTIIGSVLAITSLTNVLTAQAAFAGSNRPQEGCYERVYEARHLKAHKGQFVTKAKIEISPAGREQRGGKWGIVANADLRIWVKGYNKPFESYGACSLKGGALVCGGSVSAAEEDECRSSRPGVQNCRVDMGDAGGFRIEARSEGVVVKVPKRLELVRGGSDTGPYLNLVSYDGENSDFLLKFSDNEACE